MGDVINVAGLVSDLNLLGAKRQGWGMFDLQPLAHVLWQTSVIGHFFHNQPHVASKSLLQL